MAETARARLSISNLLNPADEPAVQPAEAEPTTPKRRPRAIEISRTDRIRIRTLCEIAGLSYEEIMSKTNYTWAQIQRACTGPVTPQKSKRRKGIFSTPEKQELKAWLEDGRHRYTPLYQLPWKAPFPYGETALSRAVHDINWISVIRPRRIHRDEQNLADRVNWCRQMKELRPRPQDWNTFCFSGESYWRSSFWWPA